MKNSYLISQQVPEFVLTKYPAFVEFIEAYYQWLEQEYSTQKLESLLDIENTLSDFLKYFKKELDVFNILAKSDNRFLLKNIKQLYKAKGSEAAFKFFFKIVAGKDIQITYPWHNVLKVSDGVWNQNAALFIKIISGVPDSVVGKSVTIRKGDIYHKIVIERFEPVEYVENNITKTYPDIYQFFINKEYYNKIPIDAKVSYEKIFVGYTINTTTEVKVYNKGSGFKVGELYPIVDDRGSGSIFKILEILPNGGIKSVQLVKFGVGYKDSFSFSFAPYSIKSKSKTPSSVSKNNTSIEVNTHDSYNNIIERSHITSFNYNVELTIPPAIPPSYAGELLASTYYDNIINGEENESFIATILINCNTVSKYPGYFENNNGFVSDTMFLQDNFYYQVYSYEISFDETLDAYKNLLLKTIHPSGLKVFGKQNIYNEINLIGDIQGALFKLENNFNAPVLVSDNDLVLILNTYRSDNFGLLDETILNLNKPLSDSVDGISDSVNYIKLDKPITDSNGVNDNTTLSLLKPITETQNINDTLSISLIRQIDDSNNIEDTPSLSLTKSIFDTVVSEDSVIPRIINPINSSVSSSDNISSILLNKYINETATTTDSIVITLFKSISETATIADSGTWLLKQSYLESDYIVDGYFESFTGSIN